jgi:hypothetical protein
MPTIKEVMNELSTYYSLIQDAVEKKSSIPRANFRDETQYDRVIKKINDDVKGWEQDIASVLERFEREPPRLVEYADKLPAFYKDGSGYDTSVFIMTKFPAKGDDGAAAKKLNAVIEAVREAIQKRGLHPRIAYEKDYEDWIWANVEMFMFGCARGIAILEARYISELNPNVAMEWGWMKGMGKPVLFLMEGSFPEKFKRADWSGLDPKTFNWDDPVADIDAHVAKFLK